MTEISILDGNLVMQIHGQPSCFQTRMEIPLDRVIGVNAAHPPRKSLHAIALDVRNHYSRMVVEVADPAAAIDLVRKAIPAATR